MIARISAVSVITLVGKAYQVLVFKGVCGYGEFKGETLAREGFALLLLPP